MWSPPGQIYMYVWHINWLNIYSVRCIKLLYNLYLELDGIDSLNILKSNWTSFFWQYQNNFDNN